MDSTVVLNLVKMPVRVFGVFDDITLPEFSALAQLKAWKWDFKFFVIGNVESLLNAKAIDLLYPRPVSTSSLAQELAAARSSKATALHEQKHR